MKYSICFVIIGFAFFKGFAQQNTDFEYLYYGDERLKAGHAETIYIDEKSGLYFGEIQIQIADRKGQKMVVFWDNSIYEHDFLWTGNVLLYLHNGNVIKLVDRNIKGKNTIKNGYNEGKEDLHQRYSMYYLTDSECNYLRTSEIDAFSYETEHPLYGERVIINIKQNNSTCQKQLKAIE